MYVIIIWLIWEFFTLALADVFPLESIIIFIYSHYFYLLHIFTSVLADGLSLEFEWQQVSSSLQDSSQYSGHSQ